MPFLVTVGISRDNAMDQAKLIMGDDATILSAGHQDNVNYFQFNTQAPVQSPIPGFQAGIQGGNVCVVWVEYT